MVESAKPWKAVVEPPSSPETRETAPDATESAQAHGIRRRSWLGFVVFVLVVAALALRLWGITWALPNQDRYFTYHPDEGVNLVNGVLENGAFRPHADLGFYNYGTLYFYLWQGAAAVNRAYGFVSLPHTDPPRTSSPESIASLILVGRLLTAGLGALTVWLVFALGFRLYGRWEGILAAVTAAVIPLAVVHGHFATVDVTATFFIAAALALGARLLDSRLLRDAALAGALCGLAAAAKYNAGLVLIAPLAAIVLSKNGRRSTLIMAAVLVAAAFSAFLIACPGPILNPSRFWADFAYEVQKSRQGMGLLFEQTGIGWVYHLTSSLRYGLGLPLLALSLAAVGVALWKRKPQDLYLLSFLLLYYLVIGAAQVRFMRYMIPMLPVIAVLIGRLLANRWTENKGLMTAVRAGGAVALVLTLGISLALTRLMVIPDARDEALDFIRNRIPKGQVLAFARTPWYDVPPLAPGFTAPNPSARREAAETQGQYAIRLPQDGRELEVSVFEPTLPDAVILSDIATQDWERLKIPEWTALKERLSRYTPNVFECVPSFAGINLGKPDHVPNDLLYIYPRITIYTRKP